MPERHIEDRILDAIRSAGLDPAGRYAPEELGALDHFHTGGRTATAELLELLEIRAGDRILDVGAGIGGPARVLAHRRGCRVVCLEPSAECCRAARLLNRLTGLEEKIEVHQGAAPTLPFDDAAFDGVWIQNVGMHVPDKARLYGEIRRALKPGGWLAFQEYARGDGRELFFPLPWASAPAESFLVSPDGLRALLDGFKIERFEDMTAAELGRPPAGNAQGPLTLGEWVEDLPTKSKNARRCLEEGRIRLFRGVGRRL